MPLYMPHHPWRHSSRPLGNVRVRGRGVFDFLQFIHARLTEYGDTGLSEPLSPHSSLSLTRTGTRGALGARERAAAPRPAPARGAASMKDIPFALPVVLKP
eukprot:scaffold50563_cov63-Phaeocystis_antarctica.AAC.8